MSRNSRCSLTVGSFGIDDGDGREKVTLKMNARFLKLCRLTQGTSKPGSLSHATFCVLLHEVISFCAWQKTTLRRTHLKVKFKRKSYALSMQSFHSAKERFGVDVCLTNEDLTKAPECPHGRHFSNVTVPTGFSQVVSFSQRNMWSKAGNIFESFMRVRFVTISVVCIYQSIF